MKRRTSPAGEPSPYLVDAVIEGYVAWREQSAAVKAAYEGWTRARSAEREAAFAGYQAALDREEWAAARYQWLIGRVAQSQQDAEPAVDQAA